MRLTCKEKKAMRLFNEAYKVFCNRQESCRYCPLRDYGEDNCKVGYAKLLITKSANEENDED